MRDELYVLNPTWYIGPVLIFLIAYSGRMELLENIPFINRLAAFMTARDDSLSPEVVIGYARLKALSLMLLPLTTIGVFWMIWRTRVSQAEAMMDRGGVPPFGELVSLTILLVGGFIHYFVPSQSNCSICPRQGSVMYAFLESAVHLTLALMPLFIAMLVHARLYAKYGIEEE